MRNGGVLVIGDGPAGCAAAIAAARAGGAVTMVGAGRMRAVPECASAGALRLLDACYQRALRPAHDSCRLPGHELAEAALYVRSHWLRMPFGLLTRHLLRKAWTRMTATPEVPKVDTP